MENSHYTWRTVQDSKVRSSHSDREGKVFSWTDPPDGGHPGEDFNCRCWAETEQQVAEGLKQTLTITGAGSGKKWGMTDFFHHFYFGNGAHVTLSEIGHLAGVIAKSREAVFHKVEEQVAEKMREIQSGTLFYDTEQSYYFGDVQYELGDSVVRTETNGKVTRNGNKLTLDATVQYEYDDTFTDIADVIPFCKKNHRCAQSRSPIDMMVHGWSMSLFQASQQ